MPVVNECRNAGMLLKFDIPVEECKDIELMVSEDISISVDRLIIKGTLKKVSTKQIKGEDGIEIWKTLEIIPEAFYTLEGEEDTPCMLLDLPDTKQDFIDSIGFETAYKAETDQK